MVLVDYALGIPSPKLQVPNKFKVSSPPKLLCARVLFIMLRFTAERKLCTLWADRNLSHLLLGLISVLLLADQGWSWLDYKPSGAQSLVDHHHHLHPCSPLHHPHLHGSADHSCHYQQEGAQTEGVLFKWFIKQVLSLPVQQMCRIFFKNHKLCHLVNPAERLRLPPGPVCGGGDAGGVLRDGLAVVCGGHRALHLAREQPEAGVGVLGSRGAAQIPGHPRATLHRPHDLHSDGLLCLHDLCAEGQDSIELH